jgi:hypothetical protein
MHEQIGAGTEPRLLGRVGQEIVARLAQASSFRELEITADRDGGDRVGERSSERGDVRGRLEASAAAEQVLVDGVHLCFGQVPGPVADEELVRERTGHAALPSTQRWSARIAR